MELGIEQIEFEDVDALNLYTQFMEVVGEITERLAPVSCKLVFVRKHISFRQFLTRETST